MPPHNQVVAIRPRSLANVLADLKEAHEDLNMAHVSALADEPDANDRYNEAETRVDDLREEFDDRFEEATGLTWKQIEQAVSEAVL